MSCMSLATSPCRTGEALNLEHHSICWASRRICVPYGTRDSVNYIQLVQRHKGSPSTKMVQHEIPSSNAFRKFASHLGRRMALLNGFFSHGGHSSFVSASLWVDGEWNMGEGCLVNEECSISRKSCEGRGIRRVAQVDNLGRRMEPSRLRYCKCVSKAGR